MRASNRAILGGKYIEIFIDTTLEICQARDPKGLYAKAARGEITHFTGIDSPFEIPQNADLVVNTEGRRMCLGYFFKNTLKLLCCSAIFRLFRLKSGLLLTTLFSLNGAIWY